MARGDWARNSDWNDGIELEFYRNLRRARIKDQPLRSQAVCLARTNPSVSLRLIDEYFALEGRTDILEVFVLYARAEAYLTLNDIDAAIAAFELVLRREEIQPGIQTNACFAFPYLVASLRLADHYETALAVLERSRDRYFACDHFLYHATQAMIFSETGQEKASREHAAEALKMTEIKHSGLRYHPTVGLLDSSHDDIIGRLTTIMNKTQ